MGSALLSRWINGPEEITVVDPVAQGLPEDVELVRDRADIGGRTFDCIVAAVKPQMLEEVMPPFEANLQAGGYVLSIAAGFAAKRLSDLMGGAPVVRTMPNLPAAIGRGVSGIFAASNTTAAHEAHALDFMGRAGTTIMVESEESLDRVTAVAGSGPGYVFEIARAYTEAAMAQGFDEREARDMVLQTMSGAIAMAIEDEDTSLEALRDSVTSKGGTTAAGLEALNGDNGLTDRMHATLQACYERAVELR